MTVDDTSITDDAFTDTNFMNRGSTERIEMILESASTVTVDSINEIKAKQMKLFTSGEYHPPNVDLLQWDSIEHAKHYKQGFESFQQHHYTQALNELNLAFNATKNSILRYRIAFLIETIVEILLTEIKNNKSGGCVQEQLLMSEFDNLKSRKNPSESKYILSLSGFFNYPLSSKELRRHTFAIKEASKSNNSPKTARTMRQLMSFTEQQTQQPMIGPQMENKFGYINNPKDLHLCVNAELISQLMSPIVLNSYIRSIIRCYQVNAVQIDSKANLLRL